MVFIAILLALALERFFDWSHLRHWQWFDHYCQMLSSTLDRFNPPLRLAFCLLPPVLVVGFVEHILSAGFFGLFALIFDFLILLYCFGPINFWAETYSHLSQGDKKAALPEVVVPISLSKNLVPAIYLEGERRVFAVLFWFSILGPVGAVLYRLIVLAHNNPKVEMAVITNKAFEIIEWLPARVLGFLFALGGHFVKVLQVWRKYAFEGFGSSELLITETGLAALDLPPQRPLPENGEVEKQAIQLFDRALFMMVVLSALLVLIWP